MSRAYFRPRDYLESRNELEKRILRAFQVVVESACDSQPTGMFQNLISLNLSVFLLSWVDPLYVLYLSIALACLIENFKMAVASDGGLVSGFFSHCFLQEL